MSSHFIKGGTLIGGLGQQGNKCHSHTDQDFILLQRWMGILIRMCDSLRQKNAWTAMQDQQIYIFMNNNNIVSIAVYVGDRCIWTTPAFCLMAKRKYSASCRLIIVRQQLKTSKTPKTICLRKEEKREENHTEALSFSRRPPINILSSHLQTCFLKPAAGQHIDRQAHLNYLCKFLMHV